MSAYIHYIGYRRFSAIFLVRYASNPPGTFEKICISVLMFNINIVWTSLLHSFSGPFSSSKGPQLSISPAFFRSLAVRRNKDSSNVLPSPEVGTDNGRSDNFTPSHWRRGRERKAAEELPHLCRSFVQDEGTELGEAHVLQLGVIRVLGPRFGHREAQRQCCERRTGRQCSAEVSRILECVVHAELLE